MAELNEIEYPNSELEWLGTESKISNAVVRQTNNCLGAYRENKLLIPEHAGLEDYIFEYGYSRKQVFELIQNAADALSPQSGSDERAGIVKIVLTADALYCADNGHGIDESGVGAILNAHLSVKRDGQIGRFGLGFKSILQISDGPQFFSFPGSFGFDRDRSESQISEICGDEFKSLPVLRLAWPLDHREESAHDGVLADLMSWASTVIKAPLKSEIEFNLIAEELKAFPQQFLLFTEHVNTLVLENRAQAGFTRVISRDEEDGCVMLADGNNRQAWHVFADNEHELSALAKQDAGNLHDRDHVPVVWAVPKGGNPGSRGAFWTFFPSGAWTSLTGILNAPWKVNEDRTILIDGRYNRELMEVAAELIANSLPGIKNDEDPGAIFDIIPARGNEEPTELGRWFVGEVYSQISNKPSIPDQNGDLRVASEIKLIPDTNIVSEEAATRWSIYENRPPDWSHRSIQKNDNRHSKIRRIKKLATGFAPDGNDEVCESVLDWLGALVSDGSPAGSIAAIRTADECLNTGKPAGRYLVDDALKSARIVLTNNNQFVHMNPGEAYFPARVDMGDLEVPLVHSDVLANRAAQGILIKFGFQPVATDLILTELVKNGFSTWTTRLWGHFWGLSMQLPEALAAKIILNSPSISNDADRAGETLKVINPNGDWRKLNSCILPGGIVQPGDSENQSVLVDMTKHRSSLLKLLGASEFPQDGRSAADEEWFLEYSKECESAYYDSLEPGQGQPGEGQLVFDERPKIGPIAPFFELSDVGRASLTDYLLAKPQYFVSWGLGHKSLKTRFPTKDFGSPYEWLLRRHGVINSSLGINVIGECVGPNLGGLSSILPVAYIDNQLAGNFGLPQYYDQLDIVQWDRVIQKVDSIDDMGLLGEIYSAASSSRPVPDSIRCRIGDGIDNENPSSVVATIDEEVFDTFCHLKTPVLLVPTVDDQDKLIKNWGLLSEKDRIRRRISYVPSVEPIPLTDDYPALSIVLETDQRDVVLIRCESLSRDTETDQGTSIVPLESHFADSQLFVSNRMSELLTLRAVVHHLGLELGENELQEILENKAADALQDRIHLIRNLDLYADKLVALVGRKPIENGLGQNLLAAAVESEGELSDSKIGDLALAAFGVTVLERFKDDIKGQGFQVPDQWAGGYKTKNFVTQLGFGSEYAGFRKANRDPTIEIAGPYELPTLHDFQAEIVDKIIPLIDSHARGMLSLPTGSGKTRVAVQAISQWIRERYTEGTTTPSDRMSIRMPVFLWIAQSDELCEQAVQTFEEVWRSQGSQETLQISRLWSTNEASEYTDGPHVVVATIDKLHSVINRNDSNYDWLNAPVSVIVDEAHRAMSTEYTQVLGWAHTNISNRRNSGDQTALLGLTATPFRGWSESATKQLVNRFGQNRLDIGVLGDEPYKFLQDGGYLAHVEQEILDGSEIALNETELQTMKGRPAPPWLPATAEQRIAEDSERNRMLMEHMMSKPEDWPMIVFCASVDHSKTMAGLLNLNGINSASVSSETDAGARRHYVEEFRKDRIRILTNHSVLAQGFDAPSVRAIYIARPVFSPNVYQQMIGRGLRGPKNGGKDKCLIVNVKDTFKNFEGTLAFSEFEHLWAPD